MIRAVPMKDERPAAARLVTEQVACGACGQRDRKRLYTEQYELGGQRIELGINRCTSCGQVYVSPRLDHVSTQHVYQHDQRNTISHNYCWSGETSDERFEPLLDRLTTMIPSGALLDVGCGGGNFLAAADRRNRWQLIGLEPSSAAAQQARTRLSVPVLARTLDQASLPSRHFQVVTMLGVLEHLHHPLETLRHVNELLKRDGVLAVYVPNFHYLRIKDAGLMAWLRHRRSSCLAPQEHLYQFTPRLLTQLLRYGGFRVERMDVGRPFINGNTWQRRLKTTAFAATKALHWSTGVHLGGIEVIARRVDRDAEPTIRRARKLAA